MAHAVKNSAKKIRRTCKKKSHKKILGKKEYIWQMAND